MTTVLGSSRQHRIGVRNDKRSTQALAGPEIWGWKPEGAKSRNSGIGS